MNKKTTIPLIVFIILVSAGTSAALNPLIPAGYYGSITLDGQPAPAGTTIIAKIGTEERGSITTASSGSYGGPGGPDLKLGVLGYAGENGSIVTFFVNNVAAQQTTTWTSGEIKKVDLTFVGVTTGGGGPSGGSGSSTGGGGGVVSGEPFDNIEFQETRTVDFKAGVPVTVSFTLPGHAVYELMITPNVSAGPTDVQIQQLKGTSKLVSSQMPGSVYKNVNIWIGSPGFAVPANIREGIIRFRINNSWLTDDIGDIGMMRWDGSNWNPLDTGQKNKDDNVTYYEAMTTSFSPFAISGMGGTVATPGATQPVATPGATVTVPPEQAPPINFALIIGVIVLIAIVAAALYLKRR